MQTRKRSFRADLLRILPQSASSSSSTNNKTGMNVKDDDWWSRSALTMIWVEGDTPYFPSCLLPWVVNDPHSDSRFVIKTMNYSTFFHLCAHLSKQLLLLPQEECLQKIVVAIPEGPLLPLTVAAVHVLNATHHRSILIPVDPRHAAVVVASFSGESVNLLVCGDCDRQRIERCYTNGVDNQHRIIDVRDLLPLSREEYPKHTDRILPHHPPTTQGSCLASSIASYGDIPLLVVDSPSLKESNWISHIVFTSGTSTGRPKGCMGSRQALAHYLAAKNKAHGITSASTVFLASSISFDPCFSDILATLSAKATLALQPLGGDTVSVLRPTHILCTPTQWKTYSRELEASTTTLQVVALGGERIPKSLQRSGDNYALHSTYGVTEACVYQTMGESSLEETGCVGQPFPGMEFEIWEEASTHRTVVPQGCSGEVVLYGSQLDEFSGYYKQLELTQERFLNIDGRIFYRTGDLGFERDKRLHIVGRIAGDDMVKWKGVRVELGDIEQALVSISDVIDDAIVVGRNADDECSTSVNDIYAYVTLTPACWAELDKEGKGVPESGLLCAYRPLLVLLQACCRINTRVVPSAFIIVAKIPTTVTGKRNRRGVPPIEEARPLTQDRDAMLLSEYGRSGQLVAHEIRAQLNLLPSQVFMMTANASYSMLGGDSLAATQIVRSLYAKHNNVRDSRHLGGGFGVLEGPFGIHHFLSSRTLGDYVDWLDVHNAFPSLAPAESETESRGNDSPSTALSSVQNDDSAFYDALLQACSMQCSYIAIALLAHADPNLGQHGFRIGKTKRVDRKALFRSSPLHLACLHGTPHLVQALLHHGAQYNSPNPSGMFPIHLAASGENRLGDTMTGEEQNMRLQCIKHLLQAGAPVTTSDGSKQSVLHSAARVGNNSTLQYLVEDWTLHSRKTGFEWRDVWSRTPVHWAVLNGRPEALEILLKAGSKPNPKTVSPKKVHTSLILETPLEVCRRAHGDTEIGKRMERILLAAVED